MTRTVRIAAFLGNLVLEGFDVRLDPAKDTPLASAKSAESDPGDQYWHDLAGPSGKDDEVWAMTVYDNILIAGGDFIGDGKETRCHGSARCPLKDF